MQALLKISTLIDSMSLYIGKSIIWLIFIATFISAGNALMRKFFSISSNAYLEIQWYLFGAVFLLGAGYALLENVHVRIDFVAGRLSRKVQLWIDILGITLFLLPLCYFMIVYAWPITVNAFVSNEMSSNAGGLIRWPAYALVPLGFFLLGLQGISELIKRLGTLTGDYHHLVIHAASHIDPIAMEIKEDALKTKNENRSDQL